jgi:hypothetical protein
MITIEKLIEFVAILCSSKFYGSVVLIIENGEIKRIEKTEKIVSL